MIKDAIRKVAGRGSLSEAEAHAAMGQVMDGQATPARRRVCLQVWEDVGEMGGDGQGRRDRVEPQELVAKDVERRPDEGRQHRQADDQRQPAQARVFEAEVVGKAGPRPDDQERERQQP